MSETLTTLLPVAGLPAVVLPGATVTLQLSDPALRDAVEAARADAGGRIAFVIGPVPAEGETLGVVAVVPDVGNLPGGEPAAIVRIERRARLALWGAWWPCPSMRRRSRPRKTRARPRRSGSALPHGARAP